MLYQIIYLFIWFLAFITVAQNMLPFGYIIYYRLPFTIVVKL